MKEIVNFVKEILMLETTDFMPVGLCAFENVGTQKTPIVKQKKKRELRLSELMDK
jgi:hypothetical protein